MPSKDKTTSKERDVHIYIDDATGDMYVFNGKQLVKIGNTTPQIGDRGDEEIQQKEAEERKAQIEKDKEEYGDDEEEETEEERQARLDDIKKTFGDDSVAADIENEATSKVNKELRKKKAAEENEKNKYSSSIQRFRQSLRRFIAKQVSQNRDRSWKREDPSYEGSEFIRPGRIVDDNTKIPKINVYFDQSGSWGDNDIKVGEEAIGILNNYVERGEITIDIFYFGNHVSGNRNDVGRGTGAGAELIEHIIATKPDNVIVMTDDDFDHWDEITQAPNIKVPGAVWFLFRRGQRSIRLQQHLRGKSQTRVFDI